MKNKFLVICCVFVLVLSTFVQASSTIPTLNVKLLRGTDNMCYYVDANATEYTSEINTGIRRWTQSGYSPSGAISMTAVSSTSATDLDFYEALDVFYDERGVIAETRLYSSSSKELEPFGDEDYYYTRVYINCEVYPDLTSFHRIGTIAHEVGHVLGLYENNSSTSKIMCQYGAGRSVNTVSEEEYEAVIDIYGG